MTHPTSLTSHPYGAPPLPRRSLHGATAPLHASTATFPPGVPAAHPLPARAQRELAERRELIRQLGLRTDPDDEYDGFAREMAQQADFLYGFVNLFMEEQTFIGLYQPAADSGHVIVGRTMDRGHGYCPEVVDRKRALPLPDVHASPRFSGNHVVDAVGIRAYFGAPLIHDESGIVLGTVCVVDTEKRPMSEARRLRDITIATGSQVMRRITGE
ncbi:GAF domain-containing protein [Streptomyces sp. NPDC056160]|uniref:GAF domain-containing protein n=1 Tax=Streptomyces sp. NPDC056160 TaxID=3345731 RepID=UPI0035E193CE